MEKKTASSIHVKVPSDMKKEAEKILGDFGIDLNTYLSMAVARLVEENRIPFSIGFYQNANYTPEEACDEVRATLSMEGFTLDSDDLNILRQYSAGELSGNEIRNRILDSL